MENQKLKKMNVAGYTGNYKKNEQILLNGGAVRITTWVGSGRWTRYYQCKCPAAVPGYDLVLCNDAPRGGQLGNYMAATKSGDKTAERAQFIKEFRKNWRENVRKQFNRSEEGLRKRVADAVTIVADVPAPVGDSRYYINGYHGCGVYRLAISSGKIVATLHGGYGDSKPDGVDYSAWVEAVNKYITEKIGGDLSMIKADGSCGQFFLRNEDDATLIDAKQYAVPHAYGRGNMGYYHLNTQINY